MTAQKLWGGRFRNKPEKIFEEFSRSLSFDHRLWKEELTVLQVHVEGLLEAGILKKETGKRILPALSTIRKEIAEGKLSFDGEAEDIHSFLEEKLKKRVGQEASLIRIARSRNDTIATDSRLYLKKEILEIRKIHEDYLKALLSLARRFETVVIPGYTHFRKAQPVLLPFYCLAHFAAGMRERNALEFAFRWTDVSPLGAGAIAGTSWPIPVKENAARLGFSGLFFNALDATGDRDFLLAFYFSASLILTHLSRFCEDLILWSSDGLGYIELPDSLCTGSSLMPQKKNPDSLELIRGKSARILGHLSSAFFLLKGLPLGYNRDLQEDKELLFDSVKTLRESLKILILLLEGISINQKALSKVWSDDFALATDFADEMVKQGYSFGEAHEMIGKVVRYAIEKEKSFRDLSSSELSRLLPKADVSIFSKISIKESVNRKESPGGTGRKSVSHALHEAEQWLKRNRTRKPNL